MTWPACTTSRTCSGPPLIWPGTGSAPASTGTSPTTCPNRSARCARPATRTYSPSPGAGPAVSRPAPWPDTLDEWLALCHQGGQSKSAQILLRYRAGDWNALHRDLFGNLVFPLQVVIGLDEHGTDYTGGEFLLVEQRPRAQSRGTATVLPQGHGLIFTTRDRPLRSARGWSAAPVRHGVSTVRSGHRHTLGLVFHDA